MPDQHALLSASSSKRWLHCPPSVRLEEGFPNESSIYAKEGTFAHSLCEYKLGRYLNRRVTRPQSEEFYSEEIEQITDVYLPPASALRTFLSLGWMRKEKVFCT